MIRLIAAATLLLVPIASALAQSPAEHEHRGDALIIRNAIVVEGPGTPAEGPVTIIIRENRIDAIVSSSAALPKLDGDVREIDAEGRYVLPGFINMHAHMHGPWGLSAFPMDYIYKLWLGSGITTVRDVGSVGAATLRERDKSAKGDIVAPRIYAYLWFPKGMIGSLLTNAESLTEESLRAEVRALKAMGADGLKLRHFDRETTAIIMDEAKEQGLRIAHHVGVEDMNAWDNATFGTTTIEHWYGVPEAALHGVQEFPADFNHANELHRFRYAGRVWRETDPERVEALFQSLIENNVAWDPTFAIYEAARDLQRALTQPAFEHYLHPAMERFFAPDPERHGSFFFGWTNTDEVYWKENYRIWMDAVRQFKDMGGTVTTGEDAGFIYQLFGFCYLRELQLHEEAGFHPLEVIAHATTDSARVLGEEDALGRIRPGHLADLVIVNGNPLENLQVLMPRGLDETLDLQGEGGIEWTIKDGYTYHAPTLLEEVREIVAAAREAEAN